MLYAPPCLNPTKSSGNCVARDVARGYDAALTQLRSWVRFPFLVLCASGLQLDFVNLLVRRGLNDCHLAQVL